MSRSAFCRPACAASSRVYFREPSQNLGVGERKGVPPHLTGKDFLTQFGIPQGSPAAYALTSEDFTALAKTYGRIGGLDRLATAVKAVRAERGDDRCCCSTAATPGRARSRCAAGQDVADCMKLLKPDAMTGHWEFTYGEDRVKQLVDELGFPFLALNMRDTEWQEPVFEPTRCSRRRREGRRPGRGLRLYADREPALDVPELDVRHPRGGRAGERREGAARGRAARRAALA